MSQNYLLRSNILRRVEQFITQLEKALGQKHLDNTEYIQSCAEALFRMVERQDPIFGHEHWHGLEARHSGPTELLLRLKDENHEALAPYQFIMSCYDSNLTIDLDTILILLALDQYREYFRDMREKQVSINMSARFLEMRNQGAIEQILMALDSLELNQKSGEAIILEIHESAGDVNIDPMVLDLFRRSGVKFAMDDVVMDGRDVYRFSGFSGFTDFVKIDRRFLKASETDISFFAGIIDFIRGQAPDSIIVAEGVKDASHAHRLFDQFKHIHYVQGRELPDRKTFAEEWDKIKQPPEKT